jgi:hypothetical protein
LNEIAKRRAMAKVVIITKFNFIRPVIIMNHARKTMIASSMSFVLKSMKMMTMAFASLRQRLRRFFLQRKSSKLNVHLRASLA